MRIFKRKYTKKKKDLSGDIVHKLTDNVRANEILSPLYFSLICFILIQRGYEFYDAFFYSIISSIIYVYASNYFQPDLDIHVNRPGMSHFPLGRFARYYTFGRFLNNVIFYPLNRIWYYLWHPFGYLFTHRGITHWPVLGVWLRVIYLILWAFLLKKILLFFSLPTLYIDNFMYWANSFFPWDKNFLSLYFFLYIFPIYLSDAIHFCVDYYDSVRRGLSFCPPKIPRGLIAKFINFLRGRDIL